jgi:hypothetical protein
MEILVKSRVLRAAVKLIPLCALLAGSSAAWAQDVFSTNTASSGDPCQDAYQSAIAGVLQESTASNAQYQQDLANCKFNSSCNQNAQNQNLARERNIDKEKVDIGNQRDICHLQQQLAKAGSSGDPCQDAYQSAIEPVLQESANSEAQFQKDLIDCQNNSDCNQNATNQRLARESNINQEKTNLSNQRDACHREQQQGGTNNPRNGTPGNNGGSPLQGQVSQNGNPSQNIPPSGNTTGGQPLQGQVSKNGNPGKNIPPSSDTTGGKPLQAQASKNQNPGKNIPPSSETTGGKPLQTQVSKNEGPGKNIPPVTKALKAAPIAKFATPGQTPVNPLKGSALATAVSGAEKDLPALQGNWISTKKGPLKLGNFIGKGSFSTVFEDANNPKSVIKIGNATGESPAAFERQVKGVKRLQEAGVDTPTIDYVDPGDASRPGVIITPNVFKGGVPGPVTSLTNAALARTAPALTAMQQLLEKLAAKGYVWGDGHGGNLVFVSDGAGGLKDVVIDPDFVMTPEEMGESIRNNTTPGRVVGGVLLQSQGIEDLVNLQKGQAVSACQLSDSLFKARFPPAGNEFSGETLPPKQ